MTPEVQTWLSAAGYEYHCFISWPHIADHEIAECARRVKEAIESELRYSVPDPRVFLDETNISVGDVWRNVLSQALCRSVAMVAICAPIYYHPAHPWCGVEWAGMEQLSNKRLENLSFGTIIPIVVRERKAVPEVVAKFQYVDFSRTQIQGRHYYSTQEFRGRIVQVVERIENIAAALVKNNRPADCNKFVFPESSAFANLVVDEQGMPFGG